MTDDSNLKSGSAGLTRRSALLAGVGLATAGAFSGTARRTAMAQDRSAFYPPVTPGIEPQGARIQPYTAACVQSGVVRTFDSSGNFLPDALKHNVDAMCELIRRGAEEHGARLMSFPEFGLQVPQRADDAGPVVAGNPPRRRAGDRAHRQGRAGCQRLRRLQSHGRHRQISGPLLSVGHDRGTKRRRDSEL